MREATAKGDPESAFRYAAYMSNPSRPAPGEIYEHYKNKTCRVFSMGLDASRQEDIVTAAAHRDRLPCQFRPFPHFNGGVEAIHVEMNDLTHTCETSGSWGRQPSLQ
jgi:hypothetical protein